LVLIVEAVVIVMVMPPPFAVTLELETPSEPGDVDPFNNVPATLPGLSGLIGDVSVTTPMPFGPSRIGAPVGVTGPDVPGDDVAEGAEDCITTLNV
jgi:hypothetical protein